MNAFKYNEDLLHYIWRFRKYDQLDLRTVDGQKVKISHPGFHNHHAGPDFLDARVTIGDTQWAGHIEIHKNSSDWLYHRHQNDPAYKNVVLHVVYHNDRDIAYDHGKSIACLELKNRTDQSLFQKYNEIMFNANWIPCASYFDQVSDIKKKMWIERLVSERLMSKADRIQNLLKASKNDWDSVCYKMMAQYLGQKTNGDAFLRLLEQTSLEILLKHKTNVFQLEAILFGQSGMLNQQDEYAIKLEKEYNFFQKKYSLEKMNAVEWKFAKMRPSSFPTLRIAQLAVLISTQGRIFQKILDQGLYLKELSLQWSVECSDYWNTHYRFGKESKFRTKKIGEKSLQILMINGVCPLLFAYGEARDSQKHKDHALEILQSCKAESNGIIKKWSEHKIDIGDATVTQALLQLKNEYCDQFRCLECAIGFDVMGR